MDKQLNTQAIAYTAEIELTGFILYGNHDFRASGRIYHDVHQRWFDGAEIITSPVENIHSFNSDGFIRTRNSVYKLRVFNHG
ncbi:hypothetical protein AB204_01110 [Xenorhabdus khoisanae]|uniref:Uncharacterized protein n=1 Tax=Xenorhabdus khoisanae TaxID=880157 RepID=A0A0J5FXJ3_9GAMM|nr:hypothetical protein [Xenorhabdus khoisanae]KMJ46921.1 hypothetical protein AB204_01110 [Xenorhabdus khoisanae]